jgi:hypothetical protein
MVRAGARHVKSRIRNSHPEILKLLSAPMLRVLPLLLTTSALAGVVAADLPRKAPLTKYSTLWTDSPFTSKPPPPEQVAAANPLEDYALAGVSPIPDGYRVTLLNRKDPQQRIVVETHKPSEGFKILGINRKPASTPAASPATTPARRATSTRPGRATSAAPARRPAAEPPNPAAPSKAAGNSRRQPHAGPEPVTPDPPHPLIARQFSPCRFFTCPALFPPPQSS